MTQSKLSACAYAQLAIETALSALRARGVDRWWDCGAPAEVCTQIAEILIGHTVKVPAARRGEVARLAGPGIKTWSDLGRRLRCAIPIDYSKIDPALRAIARWLNSNDFPTAMCSAPGAPLALIALACPLPPKMRKKAESLGLSVKAMSVERGARSFDFDFIRAHDIPSGKTAEEEAASNDRFAGAVRALFGMIAPPQTIGDVASVLGIDPDAEREVEHFFFFDDRAGALAAADALAAHRYSVRPSEPDDGLQTVVATGCLSLHQDLRALRQELEQLAAAHHGTYDGWGMAV